MKKKVLNLWARLSLRNRLRIAWTILDVVLFVFLFLGTKLQIDFGFVFGATFLWFCMLAVGFIVIRIITTDD